jgi:dihydrofolate reductase
LNYSSLTDVVPRRARREGTMRTVTYGAACSLDGFIAGPDTAMDWLHYSEDVSEVMAEYFKTIDTMLLGRKTWEYAQAMAAGGSQPPEEAFIGIQTYVFSRTLDSLPDPRARLVRDDAVDFVRDLKRQPGRGICVMGGGELARSLFEADLIDEVGLNIHPVLLGGGIPMFPAPGPRVSLKLLSSRVLSGGCVLANFKVQHRRPRKPAKSESAVRQAEPVENLAER